MSLCAGQPPRLLPRRLKGAADPLSAAARCARERALHFSFFLFFQFNTPLGGGRPSLLKRGLGEGLLTLVRDQTVLLALVLLAGLRRHRAPQGLAGAGRAAA